jgi:hypothetical protein
MLTGQINIRDFQKVSILIVTQRRPGMEKREQLIALVMFSHAEIHRFADLLELPERSQVGLVDRWSPHDVLAHLAEEHRRLAGRMEHMSTNRNEEEPEEFDGINAATWEAYRDR